MADPGCILEEEFWNISWAGREQPESGYSPGHSLPGYIKKSFCLTLEKERQATGKTWFSPSFFLGGGRDENRLSLDQKVTVLGLQGKMFTGTASLEAIDSAHQNRNGSAILLLRIYPSGLLAHVHKNLSTKIFTVALFVRDWCHPEHLSAPSLKN